MIDTQLSLNHVVNLTTHSPHTVVRSNQSLDVYSEPRKELGAEVEKDVDTKEELKPLLKDRGFSKRLETIR